MTRTGHSHDCVRSTAAAGKAVAAQPVEDVRRLDQKTEAETPEVGMG